MKKLLSLLLCLVLLSSSALAADFSAADAQAAQTAALRLMKTCAFSAEFGGAHSLTRWTKPLRIYVGGEPTFTDLRELNSFLTDLAVHVPMLPNVSIVENKADANITLYYVPLRDMDKYVTNYVEGNWGLFTYWRSGSEMVRAEIAIATDVTTQKARTHLMKEELVGVLGLTNDHELYEDSILYQPWTTTQELSDVDWLMLNMLYHPDVKPGMIWEEFFPITNRRINDR